ncbi:hypothetical protein [Dichotomicrobium thermohalophilum]|uniref:Uncharacterized protein n=1 Tax=Dichotomicrobium thermohalophilum TaxID=933063 RepID=A0A397Q5C2_9HYPH|nr:hypothetical protein [Dichotomicrobium thermohalophilum]RIA55629.1 hypothetical protein BXY53_0699 [Dichotomicrobium thermohalophilum]
MMTWFRSSALGVFVAAVSVVFVGVPAAQAACTSEGAQLIDRLDGQWRGTGTVTPIGGQPERILCRISYAKTRGGQGLRQVINCAGTDYRIQASANVRCNGNTISGLWTENIANNTGRINGRLEGQRLRASFKGPNFEGRLSVNFASRGRHTVTISQFDPAKGRHVPVAQISLRK